MASEYRDLVDDVIVYARSVDILAYVFKLSRVLAILVRTIITFHIS